MTDRTYATIDLVIEGHGDDEGHDAWEILDRLLDEGVLQDAINAEGDLLVLSCVARPTDTESKRPPRSRRRATAVFAGVSSPPSPLPLPGGLRRKKGSR